MGKRGGRKQNNRNNGSKKVKEEWTLTEIPEDNALFREYYEIQLNLDADDFQQFWVSMKEKLPVVFRVNQNCSNYRKFCMELGSPEFIKQIVDFDGADPNDPDEPSEPPCLKQLEWYPNKTVFELNTNKQQFKRSKILNNLHKYLQKQFDSGLIARQELVSMLPPLYLDIQSNDIVLDMCAAPGSKTQQILEIMYGENKWLAKGGVIANDADYSRAQMLIHQINRIGTAGMAVINHPGQFMPELIIKHPEANFLKSKYCFDKILCDVPCSGDGATRKLPVKWKSWHTSDGISLHPLQLSILTKGINMLKKGGLLVYSTCSLNPIENEAVIAGLMSKVEQGLEIVDIHPIYAVKGRRGLLQWQVFTAEWVKDEEQGGLKKHKLRTMIPDDCSWNPKIKQTMFPPNSEEALKIGLHHSMRILPHDQNTGGFFVALFKKHEDFQWKYQNKKQQQEEESEKVAQEENEIEIPVMIQNFEEPVPEEAAINSGTDEDGEEEEIVVQENGEEEQIAVKPTPLENLNDENYHQTHAPPDTSLINKSEQIKKFKKQRGDKYDVFVNISQEEFDSLKSFYGLSEEFKYLLYVRENCGTQRKVVLVSEAVHKYLVADTENKIKLVNMGCIAFERGKESFAGHQCLYRLCQEGIHFLMDHITQRKVKVSLDFFIKMINVHTLPHEEITDFDLREQIKNLIQGSFYIFIDQHLENGVHLRDAIVGQNFKNSFHLMASKEEIASLSARYQ